MIIDGVEIESSPLLLDIVTRDCTADGDPLRVATSMGLCVCGEGSSPGPAGKCVADQEGMPPWLLVLIIVGVVVLGVLIVVAVMWYMHKKRMDMLRLPADEFEWPDPPVCLGRGSFGQVVRGCGGCGWGRGGGQGGGGGG